MKTKDFHFELPKELIAQYPLEQRSDSRLLVYLRDTQAVSHQAFTDLLDFLNPGDLLVLNDSKVIPARFYGQKASGGQVQFLVERIIAKDTFWAHIKASKAPKPQSLIYLDKGFCVEILEKADDLYRCRVEGLVSDLLENIGHIPLPLYIDRNDETLDHTRYQTVYARHKGSVAAPTAGLHFDEVMMQRLSDKKIQIDYVTLHVGAGTFRAVRTETIEDHVMHHEYCSVSETLCQRIAATKRAGNRVIAVGTTALRSLESAARSGQLQPYSGETNIFIYPGFSFQVCDGLMTNFHVPESTLLMLVAAFIGHQEVLSVYQTAVNARYRFFSYGDVCLFL